MKTRAALATAALLLIAAPAYADDRANDLFRAGLDAMKRDQTAEACPKFAEAQHLSPSVGYAVNLARCEAKLGKLTLSWLHWKEARALARERNDERLADVERGFETVDRSVPKLLVSLEGHTKGVVVSRDDTTLDSASLGAPLALEPGRHTVRATADGHAPWSVTLDMKADGATIAIAVPDLAPLPESKPVHDAPASILPHAGPLAPPGDTASPASTQRTIAAFAAGAGLVGVGVGTYFGFRAMANNDESNKGCTGNLCANQDALIARHDAVSNGNAATVAFIAGGAAMIGGAVLWFTAPKAHPRTGAYLNVGPTRIAVEGSF